jgi:hypothetical protein
MRSYFPSEVVEYLDSKYPYAKEQCESGAPKKFNLDRNQYPAVAHLLDMLDGIPARVIRLRGDEGAEFSEAVHAIRMALIAWNNREINFVLDRIPGRGQLNPVALVRKHLLSMSDEVADAATAELAFVADANLRESLRIDISVVNSALDSGEWKAATVLAGSVVEAMLLDALTAHGETQPGDAEMATEALKRAGEFGGGVPPTLEDWSLHQLTEVSNRLGIIGEATAAQCRIAKNFRNLVHPGREIRLAQSCNRGTALAAVAAVENVITDLSS